ncbi:hypothetical protein MNBD_CHLOROFLEXI01-1573 [hydrothermal vent metagenome]|uniref:DUF4276 family protein n=1 Tax=hydrothermal vent metagenome TaxID=652676 RepID=A0A3B0VK58_9ZZZZ
MRVLIIPEDFTYDQYILKPLIQSMMTHLGKSRAKLLVCRDPMLGGIAQATDWDRIAEIIERYKMIDLFLLCVDRDGQAGRRNKLNEIEAQAAKILPANHAFFAENAWQEIEVWVLAGHDLPTDWSWQEIRQEPNPKEKYFFPLAEQKGLPLTEQELIYKRLSKDAATQYSNRIRRLCQEDVAVLESKIKSWITQKA